MLPGLMMRRELTVTSILEHASRVLPDVSLTSALGDGEHHRYTYRDANVKIAKLANALLGLGVQPGDRVATLAWNGFRHFELYYAIAGIGAVCHTINPRLPREQIAYIIRHAQDRVLFFDAGFSDLVAGLKAELPAELVLVDMAAGEGVSHCCTSAFSATRALPSYGRRSMNLPRRAFATRPARGGAEGCALLASLQCAARAGRDRCWNERLAAGWGCAARRATLSCQCVGACACRTDRRRIARLAGPAARWARTLFAHGPRAGDLAWGVPTVWLGLIEEMRAKGAGPAAFARSSSADRPRPLQ